MNAIRVNGRGVGAGYPCLLAAEIGINHNGDMSLAHRTIDAAADAGADAVKFQNYRTEDFLSDDSLTYEYLSQGKNVVESQFGMFKRCELPVKALGELKEHCDRRGLIFFSTPTGQEGIDELVRVKAALLKNGSDYLVNLPLIRAMARTGIPAVLSTGMATLAEVDDAVRAFREAGGNDLILLHCTSSYPTPPQDVHLRKIPALAAAFGCPAGLSDHSEGIIAAVGAVALGACMIEKHFTLDRALPGPDHRFSSDPTEFRSLVEGIRTLEKSLGQSAIGPTPSEAEGRQGFRLSCVARHNLPAGHRLSEADVAFRRPGTGLPPAAIDWVVGRRLGCDVRVGQVLQPGDFA
jgi:N-acetylneuraminate synthase/N,N'-diacetyllegionaminate synthase